MTAHINAKSIYIYIGNKIKLFRESTGQEKVTQEALAKAIGVTRVSIANYEAGNQAISISDLYKVAKFLNRNVHDLLPSIESVTISEPEIKLEEQTSLTEEEKSAIGRLIIATKSEGDDHER